MRYHRLLRMITGETVIAMLDTKVNLDSEIENFVTLHYPIQVINDFYESDTGMVERYSLKQWETLSKDNHLVIDMSTVMYITDIQDNYIKGYRNMVSYFYLGGQEEEKETLEKVKGLFSDLDENSKIH